LNGPVLAFALTLVIVAAVVFGLVAAMSVRLEHAAETLVTAGRASVSRFMRRAMSGLVVAEVALAIVLLIGAGLVLRSFAGLLAVDPGFRYDNVFTTEIQLPADRYPSVESRHAFWTRAFEEIRALPGVDELGTAVVVPLTGNNWTVPFERADQPLPPGQRAPDVGWQLASGSFFQAIGIPLLSGRAFDARERPGGPPVVIVSEAIEQEYFPGESAVGKHVRLGENTAEIVGVVGNIRRASLDDRPRADMYFPFESSSGMQITMFVRTSADAAGLSAPLRAAITALEPATVFLGARTLEDVASESVRVRELVLWLLGVFSMVAILLAAVGIYGVMSYAVRQRTREIGTRVAVGATRKDILVLVLRHGAAVAFIGIASGLLIATLATRSLRSILYGVSTSDPITLTIATATLALTVMLACYLPARRASAIDPARTLSS
jgi:putative ABC transport system permease protein